jgi:hypothetical protein
VTLAPKSGVEEALSASSTSIGLVPAKVRTLGWCRGSRRTYDGRPLTFVPRSAAIDRCRLANLLSSRPLAVGERRTSHGGGQGVGIMSLPA